MISDLDLDKLVPNEIAYEEKYFKPLTKMAVPPDKSEIKGILNCLQLKPYQEEMNRIRVKNE